MPYPSQINKTDERKKDRHKKRKTGREWEGEFIAIDGEGWDGKYTLLACSAIEKDIYNPDGLTTGECLKYLTDERINPKHALVGFGLSYDFENILKDIPDPDYIKLREGETIKYQNFSLKYIPRKLLEIVRHSGKYKPDGSEFTKTIIIQDTFGFFQSSFINALKKWEIDFPEEITKGKEKRGDFSEIDLEEIRKYNRIELQLLIELMNKLKLADSAACELIGLKKNYSPRTWFGPGARAANFLMQTAFIEEHPDFCGAVYDELKNKVEEKTKNFPFASAFYGGRIEAAGLGVIEGKLYDYDINSAYPFAISNLPKWSPESLIKVMGLDERKRMGMYLVRWNISDRANFYPFPFRAQNGNVFYPPSGVGWYMSPEVHAAKEIFGEQIEIFDGFLIEGTDGTGPGEGGLPDYKKCTTAKKMLEIAAIRLKAKAEKQTSEKALKLIMNSCYGKLIQQVGAAKYLNLFCASWITSTCRALIFKAIGKDTKNNVISIMTDGILLNKTLPVKLGKNLGEFEILNCKKVIQFMPGIYKLFPEHGPPVERFRGMSKKFNAEKSLPALFGEGEKIKITLRIFVTRSLALHQKNRFEGLRYKFVELEKWEEFSLKAKREDESGNFKIKSGTFEFFPPKTGGLITTIFNSKPYPVKQGAALEKEYDTAKTEKELVDGFHIGSIIENEIINGGV